MRIAVEAIFDAVGWAYLVDLGCAVLQLETAHGTAAARLAVVASQANESVTQLGAVRAARVDQLQVLAVELELHLIDAFLDVVHVLDR